MDTKNIVIAAAGFCAAVVIVGSFFTSFYKMFCGTAFGFVVTLLCFRLHYLDCERVLGGGKKNAKRIASFGYAKRLLIKGLALYACTVNGLLSFAGCAFAMVSISVAIHILNFIKLISKNQEKEGDV